MEKEENQNSTSSDQNQDIAKKSEKGQCCRLRPDRSSQGVATECPETDHFHLWSLVWQQWHAIIINHDQCSIPIHHGPFLCQIKRRDRDALVHDILPDISFRPIRQREDPDAFTRRLARVVDRP